MAFETLKPKLTDYPILAYPDFEKSFILDTDQAIGAALSQKIDDKERVLIPVEPFVTPKNVIVLPERNCLQSFISSNILGIIFMVSNSY